jgi:hypothetical protein
VIQKDFSEGGSSLFKIFLSPQTNTGKMTNHNTPFNNYNPKAD